MCELQKAFDQLVENPEREDAGQNLTFVALAVWHEDFVPSVSHFEGVSASQAGYLLDKLSRFSCLQNESKRKVRSLLQPLGEKKLVQQQVNTRDALARSWGTSVDLHREFKQLLPYQTRHYQHQS